MRNWKSMSTSVATLCARLSTTAALLITIGIARRRMTPEEWGLWMILLAINQFTNGLDLGFQFTLGIRLAALGSRGAEAEEERRHTFLSIIFLQTGIFLVDALLVLLLFRFIPWTHWFNISNPLLAAEVTRLMPAAFITMTATLPVGLIWTVFFAYHEIKFASFLSALFNFLQVAIFALAAWRLPLPSLGAFSSLVLLYFGSNFLFCFLLTVYVFIHRGWAFTLLPLSRIFAIVRSMARVSFHAFLLGMSSIVSQILGTLFSGHITSLAGAGDFAPSRSSSPSWLPPISPSWRRSPPPSAVIRTQAIGTRCAAAFASASSRYGRPILSSAVG